MNAATRTSLAALRAADPADDVAVQTLLRDRRLPQVSAAPLAQRVVSRSWHRWALPALASAVVVAVVVGVLSTRSGTPSRTTDPDAITTAPVSPQLNNAQRRQTATTYLEGLLDSAPLVAGAVRVANPPVGTGKQETYSNLLILTRVFTAPGTVASTLAELSAVPKQDNLSFPEASTSEDGDGQVLYTGAFTAVASNIQLWYYIKPAKDGVTVEVSASGFWPQLREPDTLIPLDASLDVRASQDTSVIKQVTAARGAAVERLIGVVNRLPITTGYGVHGCAAGPNRREDVLTFRAAGHTYALELSEDACGDAVQFIVDRGLVIRGELAYSSDLVTAIHAVVDAQR